MALFGKAFVEETTTLIERRWQKMGAALGMAAGEDGVYSTDAASPLRRDLALLICIANGEQIRSTATKAMRHRVEQALTNVTELLFGNALQTAVQIPDEFWQSDAGVLVSRVRWWLSADDLITISNAATLAFGENTQANRMRIARAMDRGVLAWIPDPSVANPQQNRRVLRSQVEQMLGQNELAE